MAGSRDGAKVSDLSKIEPLISQLSPQYRSAAIKTCYRLSKRSSLSNGKLLGHQIAITDYTKPSNLKLIWLTGIGTIEESIDIKCDIFRMSEGVRIRQWRA